MFFYHNFISSLKSCFCLCGPHSSLLIVCKLQFHWWDWLYFSSYLTTLFIHTHTHTHTPAWVCFKPFCLVCRWMDFCFYLYANISGKVQRLEPLGHVMAAKVPEWKFQFNRSDWAWSNKCSSMCVLNAEVQVINWNRFLPLPSFLLYFHSEMHLSWLQVSSLVRRINAPYAEGTRWHKKRWCWRCMLRRECNMARK